MHILNVRAAASLGFTLASAQGAVAASTTCCSQTIARDVVIVGGGASGAHAAVWLRDHGKSVAVIEKADQLGGHTDYFKDEESGKTINVGVQAWMEYKSAFDFPKRMNVSTSGSMEFAANEAKFIDFKTGRPVPDWVAPSPDAQFPAIQRYLDAITPYENITLPGYFNFPSDPKDIPEDLLLPFRQFVEKYDIAAAVPQIWDSTAQGLGDTMNAPTLWVMQASAVPMAKALLGMAAAAVPASGRLYDLFESVAKFLGGDVLYSTTVVSASRNQNGGVTLQTRSAKGKQTCIKAKRLLIAVEPTAENLAPFDLDKTEKDTFGKIKYASVYAGILRHPSLQPSTAYSNRSPEPGSTNYTVFPTAAQVGRIDHLGGTKDLFQFTAVGTESYTADDMRDLIAETIDHMIEAGTIPEPEAKDAELTFEIFANHGKMHAHVSAEELRAGFIQSLTALQGHKSTFYTGSAFSAGFATVLWEYNNVLLPSVIQGI